MPQFLSAPVAARAALFTLLALTQPLVLGQSFVPEDILIGAPGVTYGDPEFLPFSNLVTFQDTNNSVWVGRMDGQTGGFSGGPAADGREIQVDSPIRPLLDSKNGPEWGIDASGPAVLYNRLDSSGIPQLWFARPPIWKGRAQSREARHERFEHHARA